MEFSISPEHSWMWTKYWEYSDLNTRNKRMNTRRNT